MLITRHKPVYILCHLRNRDLFVTGHLLIFLKPLRRLFKLPLLLVSVLACILPPFSAENFGNSTATHEITVFLELEATSQREATQQSLNISRAICPRRFCVVIVKHLVRDPDSSELWSGSLRLPFCKEFTIRRRVGHATIQKWEVAFCSSRRHQVTGACSLVIICHVIPLSGFKQHEAGNMTQQRHKVEHSETFDGFHDSILETAFFAKHSENEIYALPLRHVRQPSTTNGCRHEFVSTT